MTSAAVFKALGDPTRRALFETLAGGERSVAELCATVAVSQPAVSQHLAALRQAGLVAERKAGRRTYYRLAPDGLAPLADWLDRYRAFWPPRLAKLTQVVQEMDDD